LGTISEAREYSDKYGIKELTNIIEARMILLSQTEQAQVEQVQSTQTEQAQVEQVQSTQTEDDEFEDESPDFTSLYPEFYN
jgi:hypothetical protein